MSKNSGPPCWEVHVDLFVKFAMEERGLNIDDDRVHLPDEHCNEENAPGDIVHHWCIVLGEVNTGNLAVAAGH